MAEHRRHRYSSQAFGQLIFSALLVVQPIKVSAEVVPSTAVTGVVQGVTSGSANLNQLTSASNAGALGQNASAIAESAFAIGAFAKAEAQNSLAIGRQSSSLGINSIALGTATSSAADQSIAIGQQASTTESLAIAVGVQSAASQPNTVAIGTKASAAASNAIAIGQSTQANGSNSVALGGAAISNTTEGIAIGYQSLANGTQSIAIGSESSAKTSGSLALGYQANASAENSIAIGRLSQSAGTNSIAIGFDSISQLQSIAIGLQANATGSSSISIGPSSVGLGSSSIAIGSGSRVNTGATQSMALGAQAVVGTGSQNSVAFGPGATVGNDENNTFAMGVANSIFQFDSLATPSGFFESVPKTTTANSYSEGYVWTVVNKTYSGGSVTATNTHWYNQTSTSSGLPSASDLNAPSTKYSNIYKVVETRTPSSKVTTTSTSYKYTDSAPVISGPNVTNSTSGDVITYTNSSSGVQTQVTTTPIGVAYGDKSSSLVSAFNSSVAYNMTTETFSNATLSDGWAKADGNFSQLMVDHTGRLYFMPTEPSPNSEFVSKGSALAGLRTYTDKTATSNSTNCLYNGANSSCSPPAPSNTTKVTHHSSSSGSGTASTTGWKVPESSLSTDQIALIAKFNGSSMSYGNSSSASGSNNIAYGHGAQSHGDHSNNIAFGTISITDGTNAVAFGAGSRSQGINALAMGASSTAEGQSVISLGSNSRTKGNEAVALGARSTAFGNRVMSMGSGAAADGTEAVAIGASATANGVKALAIGDNAEANGVGVIAIGSGAKALGSNTNGVAIGTQATASGTDVTALGAGTSATGIRSTAVGAGAQASHTGSTAIGAGARTTAPGQVVLGTTTSSVVIPSLGGSGKFAGRSSQQGSTRVITTDASGNLGTSFNPKLMEQSISDIARATQTSAAIAAAFSAVPSMTQLNGEPARCGFGTGGFGSQYAIAGGCAVKISESFFLNGALSYAPSIDYNFGDTPSIAGRLGFSFPLGRIAKSKSTEALNEEVIKTIQAQQEEISELKAMVMTLRSQILELQNE